MISLLDDRFNIHDVVDHVVFKSNRMRILDVDTTIERQMNGRGFDIRKAHIPILIEVDGETVQAKRLANIEDLQEL